MGFKSFFKRGEKNAPSARPVNESGDAVQVLRVRARRRLIGAAVLVAIGVIGFPLVFETQPRPIPVDLPINIPRKETSPPLIVPAATSVPTPAVAAEKLPEPAVEKPADKPVEQAPEKVAQAQPDAVKPEAKPEPKPEPKAEVKKPDVAPLEKPVSKPVTKPVDKPVAPKPAADAARAQALLDGKTPADDKVAAAAAGKGRFVVQVGAFAEDSAAREARMKVEHLGLKTYLQTVDTSSGKRIRVRVGPFADRSEADKAAAKLKSTGLSTAVLTL